MKIGTEEDFRAFWEETEEVCAHQPSECPLRRAELALKIALENYFSLANVNAEKQSAIYAILGEHFH